MREVFMTFLWLGFTSFGGPVAHLAYFRRSLVEQRRWLDEDAYARIVAFCSVLPGPTSSQVGMLIGLTRGGPGGAFLAWLGFTAPSALLMTGLAALLGAVGAHDPAAWFDGLLGGIAAAAAAVVAHAVVGMARAHCTTAAAGAIALGAAAAALALRPFPVLQWLPIAGGAACGALLMGGTLAAPALPIRVPRGVAAAAAVLFLLLIALTLLPRTPSTEFVGTVIRAASLVFGGGHVVLPLLQTMVGDGLLDARDFFAGYGAVQAMPGPLFTFASFLGFANRSPLHGLLGAIVATVMIFAPSFALIFALAPAWSRLTALPRAGGALRGANASVVGLLAAVLYDPIVISLGTDWRRIAIALAALLCIAVARLAPWIVVAGAAAAGALFLSH